MDTTPMPTCLTTVPFSSLSRPPHEHGNAFCAEIALGLGIHPCLVPIAGQRRDPRTKPNDDPDSPKNHHSSNNTTSRLSTMARCPKFYWLGHICGYESNQRRRLPSHQGKHL